MDAGVSTETKVISDPSNSLLSNASALPNASMLPNASALPDASTLPNASTLQNASTLPNNSALPKASTLPNAPALPNSSTLPNASNLPNASTLPNPSSKESNATAGDMETDVSMDTQEEQGKEEVGYVKVDWDDKIATEAIDSLIDLQIKSSDEKEAGKCLWKDEVAMMDKSLEKTLAELENEEWYHGHLPFEDIAGLLKSDGDFLLRGLAPQGSRAAMACVTVRWDGKVQDFPVHYMVCGTEHMFTLDGKNKSFNIISVAQFHNSTKTPLSGGVMLLHPIPKQPWELTYDKVTLINKIGAGAFGEVWRGCIHESPSSPPIDVAVKMKKVTEKNKAEIDELYKEARLMRQYKHKNVVAFYGVVIKGSDSAMIVMEFIDGGSLKDYLKKNRSTTVKAKLGYAIDVAVGLVYLHSKTCMHRDVACRNCLIDVKKKIVKISDFGLSKQAESYHIPASEKLAIKWQGPEVILKHFYTLKSDVYSYGICLWEIFNNGDTPYKGIRLKEIKKKIKDPKFRPKIDPSLPIVVQKVMKSCWRADEKKRPSMDQVARFLIHAPSNLLLGKECKAPTTAIAVPFSSPMPSSTSRSTASRTKSYAGSSCRSRSDGNRQQEKPKRNKSQVKKRSNRPKALPQASRSNSGQSINKASNRRSIRMSLSRSFLSLKP